MGEPLLFPVFLRRFKTENPGEETCLECKVALRRFSRGFSWSIPTQFGYKLRRHNTTTAVLDKDESLLYYDQGCNCIGDVLAKK